MKKLISFIAFISLWINAFAQQGDPFQLTDLHIHLKGGFTIDEALIKSKVENVKYGIAANCGIGFSIQNDIQLDSFLNSTFVKSLCT